MLPNVIIQTGRDFDNFMGGVLFGVCLLGFILLMTLNLNFPRRSK